MKTLFLSLLPLAAMAAGYNTCTLPQSQIATWAGVERPTNRAYDAVCIAVLPPTCSQKPCASRACLVPDNLRACPNGDMLMYNAEVIQPFVAQSVKPLTKEDLARMNAAIDAEAKRLAAKWTDNGRVPLSPAAMTVLRNQSCLVAAANNPDIRCAAK